MTYGDAAGFESYHESRGREILVDWDIGSINGALLAASEWIDGIYGSSFIGYKTGGFTQTREWPRTNAVVEYSYPNYLFSDSEIPERVTHAAYEAAYRHLTSPGSLQADYTPAKYKSVQIDGALKVDYAQFSSAHETKIQIGIVDTLLWPLIDTDDEGVGSSTMSGGSVRI